MRESGPDPGNKEVRRIRGFKRQSGREEVENELTKILRGARLQG